MTCCILGSFVHFLHLCTIKSRKRGTQECRLSTWVRACTLQTTLTDSTRIEHTALGNRLARQRYFKTLTLQTWEQKTNALCQQVTGLIRVWHSGILLRFYTSNSHPIHYWLIHCLCYWWPHVFNIGHNNIKTNAHWKRKSWIMKVSYKCIRLSMF